MGANEKPNRKNADARTRTLKSASTAISPKGKCSSVSMVPTASGITAQPSGTGTSGPS